MTDDLHEFEVTRRAFRTQLDELRLVLTQLRRDFDNRNLERSRLGAQIETIENKALILSGLQRTMPEPERRRPRETPALQPELPLQPALTLLQGGRP